MGGGANNAGQSVEQCPGHTASPGTPGLVHLHYGRTLEAVNVAGNHWGTNSGTGGAAHVLARDKSHDILIA